MNKLKTTGIAKLILLATVATETPRTWVVCAIRKKVVMKIKPKIEAEINHFEVGSNSLLRLSNPT